MRLTVLYKIPNMSKSMGKGQANNLITTSSLRATVQQHHHSIRYTEMIVLFQSILTIEIQVQHVIKVTAEDLD